jgi:uncharacterized protein (DUF2147 family)
LALQRLFHRSVPNTLMPLEFGLEGLPLRLPASLHFLIVLLATLLSGSLPARSQTDPSGIWLTQAGDARVQVGRCGSGICGKIIWLRDPIDSRTGQPQVDDKNPNPALARRPIIGLSIFSEMQQVGATRWSGRIYNADDGQTYVAHVTLRNDSALEVEGCVGALCGGEIWTRFAAAPVAAPAVRKR